MAGLGPVTFEGVYGEQYLFQIYTLDTTFKPLGAVYAILDRHPNPQGGGYLATPIYFGQTGDLSARFEDHHRQLCFARNGANCIGIHLDGDETSRRAKETDLIRRWKPTCNQQ